MWKRMCAMAFLSGGMAVLILCAGEARSQGKFGGRNPGNAGQGAAKNFNAGPGMSRPAGMQAPQNKIGGAGGQARPNAGYQRPNTGGNEAKIGGGNVPGKEQPKYAGRPGGAASSDQLHDFLGGGNRPVAKNEVGKGEFPNVGKASPTVNVGKSSPTVNVGNVHVGNTADYTKNQQAWLNNQHANGDTVRANSGNRYATAYASGAYRAPAVGGYPYAANYNKAGAYYGWKPATYPAVGAFMGGAMATSQPTYYAYGSGGNVYYENNSVQVAGQPPVAPAQYAQQSTALLASAPAQVPDTEEWMPLGAFAFTREGVDDSQAMMELAVSKKGVIGGTYHNEATGVTRPLKGMVDQASQKVAIGFADGKNTDLVLETGVDNLTRDEAPGLLHQGKDSATPVLLVRLKSPEGNSGK